MSKVSAPKKYLLFSAGTLALGLGALGVFLPLLPTTPFVLLAAYCYMRSSEKMYRWVIDHPVFGSYFHNYIAYKAITRRARIGALIFLWTTMGLSITAIGNRHITFFLILVGIGVTIHLLALRTMPRAVEEKLRPGSSRDSGREPESSQANPTL